MSYHTTYAAALASEDREIAMCGRDAARWPTRIAQAQMRRDAIELDRKARGKRRSDKLRWHEVTAEARAMHDASDALAVA